MRSFEWALRGAVAGALVAAMAGCTLDVETHRGGAEVAVERHYGYEPGHVAVVEQAPADQVTVATEEPPPAYQEVVPANTYGPDFVWIGGNWVISGGNWVWVHGHYDRRPRHGAVWERGGWDRHGGRWEYHGGRWR